MDEQYEPLLEECKRHLQSVREGASKTAQDTWALADALAKLPVVNRGLKGHENDEGVTLAEVSAELALTKGWISQLRRASKRYPPENREPEVGPAVHLSAGYKWGANAVAKIREHKETLRLHDLHSPRVGVVVEQPSSGAQRSSLAALRRARSTLLNLADDLPGEIDETWRDELDKLESAVQALLEKARATA